MPGGRPSVIDAVVATDGDGRPIKAWEQIVRLRRAGNYIEHAAGAAGVTKQVVYDWLRTGARANRALASGRKTLDDLTPHERICAEFVDAEARAFDEWVTISNQLLANLARGGIEQTVITEKVDGAGNVIERTTKTERTLPDKAVLMWRLERTLPHLYGRTRVEVSGPDGGPIPLEERAQEAADTLRAYLEGAAAERALIEDEQARADSSSD